MDFSVPMQRLAELVLEAVLAGCPGEPPCGCDLVPMATGGAAAPYSNVVCAWVERSLSTQASPAPSYSIVVEVKSSGYPTIDVDRSPTENPSRFADALTTSVGWFSALHGAMTHAVRGVWPGIRQIDGQVIPPDGGTAGWRLRFATPSLRELT